MEDENREVQSKHRHQKSADCGIKGMETIIATVSGYHGCERFNLIKLINHTGANYVGRMRRSTTHLVCWKFEGSKYLLAQQLGTMIVSHRWFEDCAREGKRLPEHPYLMQSGHQVGPLLWEPPVDVSRKSLLSREDDIFFDDGNICKNTKEMEIEKESSWPSFHLLTEELLSDRGGKNNSSYKGKKTMRGGTSKNIKFGIQDYFPEKPFSSSKKHGGSSLSASVLSSKHTRSVYGATGNTSKDQPTRKSRRLVKKNASRVPHEPYRFDYGREDFSAEHCDSFYSYSANGASNNPDDSLTLLDCQQECPPAERYQSSTASTSVDSNCLRNEDPLLPQRSNLPNDFYIKENINEEQEVVKEVSVLNTVSIASNANNSSNVEIPFQERMPTIRASDSDGADGAVKDVGDLTELSCVICHTDFSSTRGLLPCGHRFCYSCIQQWADHMAARRKVSTCPLCKSGFLRITKVEDADSSDQKIYSQTIPCASSAEIDNFMLSDWENSELGAQHSSAPVCCECHLPEPDRLASCYSCRNRWVHSYCLDPPLFPWLCIPCRDPRTVYQRQH
ncbi:hypothetical protein MKW94_011803 [Papaver nudicaule]|uniref:RING-type E3 ubiquitin transferase BRCA1 n=1 Tax=Papaver nudicaule TaxID=74823 RepID=A0AA41V0F0_PAPNU|nr:hypothetical protein [Papaver nudicaule]